MRPLHFLLYLLAGCLAGIGAGGSPQAFADFVRAEAAKFSRIARAGGISLE